MKYIKSTTDQELLKEKTLLESYINTMIDTFNKKVSEKEEQLRQERVRLLSERKFRYSVEEINDGVYILFKEATNPVEGESDNRQWSTAFSIVNGVLFYVGHHENKCWAKANELIPQGLFKTTLKELAKIEW